MFSLINRRSSAKTFTVVVAAVAVAVLLGACGSAPGETAEEEGLPYEGHHLVVGAWGGPYADVIKEVYVPSFEAETGATVEIVGMWTEVVDAIVAAPEDDPPYDVTVGEGFLNIRGLQEDIWLPIRYENIPNADDVYPWYYTRDEIDDTDDAYGVPFGYGFEVLAYNKDELDFEPTSWSDLWRPEVQGKISMDGGYWNYAIATAAFHLDIEEGEGELYTDDGMDAVMEEMAKLDIAVWFASGADSVGAMERGEIVIGEMYAEDIGHMSERDPKYAFVIPEEGVMGWVDYYHVVRGTSEQDLAEMFINHLLDPDLQTEFAEHQYYWMASSKAEVPADKAWFTPANNDELAAQARVFDYDTFMDEWSAIEERLKEEVWTD
jgi:spermidine/putrescine transport system substrate-binding protein